MPNNNHGPPTTNVEGQATNDRCLLPPIVPPEQSWAAYYHPQLPHNARPPPPPNQPPPHPHDPNTQLMAAYQVPTHGHNFNRGSLTSSAPTWQPTHGQPMPIMYGAPPPGPGQPMPVAYGVPPPGPGQPMPVPYGAPKPGPGQPMPVAYGAPPPPGVYGPPPTPSRQRVAMACVYCRRRKIRCSGYTGVACSNCQKGHHPCYFKPVSDDSHPVVAINPNSHPVVAVNPSAHPVVAVNNKPAEVPANAPYTLLFPVQGGVRGPPGMMPTPANASGHIPPPGPGGAGYSTVPGSQHEHYDTMWRQSQHYQPGFVATHQPSAGPYTSPGDTTVRHDAAGYPAPPAAHSLGAQHETYDTMWRQSHNYGAAGYINAPQPSTGAYSGMGDATERQDTTGYPPPAPQHETSTVTPRQSSVASASAARQPPKISTASSARQNPTSNVMSLENLVSPSTSDDTQLASRSSNVDTRTANVDLPMLKRLNSRKAKGEKENE